MTDFHTNHKRMNRTRDRLQEFRDLSRQYGGRGGWWKFRQRGVSKDEDVFLHQLKSKVNIHLRVFSVTSMQTIRI